MVSKIAAQADLVGQALIRLYQSNDILKRQKQALKLEKKAGAFDIAKKAWKAYKIKKKFEEADSIPQFVAIQKERRLNRRPLRSTIV